MSEQKRTFSDPKTGEEIESTWLARWGAGLAGGLVYGVVYGLVRGLGGDLGLIFTLFVGLVGGLIFGLLYGLFGVVLGPEVVAMLLAMAVAWSIGGFSRPVPTLSGLLVGSLTFVLFGLFTRRVHNDIARQQHLRRQWLLKRKLLEEEWAGVPDGALSRASPTSEPEPTSASLSLAEAPEEDKPRLTVGVDAAMTEEESIIVGKETP